MRERMFAHIEMSHVWMRVGVVLVLFATWWWRSAVNENLRAAERDASARTQALADIKVARAALVESQAGLPDPGTGDAAWWKERLERAAKREGLAVVRHDVRATAHAIGTFKLERRELVVTGTYDAVVRLTSWLESAAPRVRLQDFDLTPESGMVRASLGLVVPVPEGGR